MEGAASDERQLRHAPQVLDAGPMRFLSLRCGLLSVEVVHGTSTSGAAAAVGGRDSRSLCLLMVMAVRASDFASSISALPRMRTGLLHASSACAVCCIVRPSSVFFVELLVPPDRGLF